MSKACDRAVNEARIDGFERLIIETIFLQAADFEIFDHDIRMQREPFDKRATFIGFKVCFNTALTAIAGMVISGPKSFAVMTFQKGRAPLARIIALPLALHFHDVCTKISKQLPAPWPRQNARQLEHAN